MSDEHKLSDREQDRLDMFSAAALNGILTGYLSDTSTSYSDLDDAEIAERSYAIAWAMMGEREFNMSSKVSNRGGTE